MSMTQREKKDEDEPYSPFLGLQKAAVLQDARCFNDREINPRKCSSILTRILWLLTQGEKLTPTETTELFFGVTKLLQAKDQQLRRLIYLLTERVNAVAVVAFWHKAACGAQLGVADEGGATALCWRRRCRRR